MLKFPFIKKKKKFMVRLTARGGKNLPLGVFEAKDMKELMGKITESLQGNEEAKKYPNIRIMDMETGTEVKMANPFTEVEELEESQSGGRRGSFLVDELVLPVVLENIKGVMLAVSQFNAEVFKGVIQSYATVLKDLGVFNPKHSIESRSEVSFKDVVELVKALPELAKHKDEIARLIKEGLGLEVGGGKRAS